jgi:hypothetical protein
MAGEGAGMTAIAIDNRGLRLRRSVACALIGIATLGATAVADAEIATKAEKSDRALKSDRGVVLASLDWQPTDPEGADWVAFKPGSPTSASIATPGKRN